VQEDADRPAFAGNGPDDYVCVSCGNVLAASMHAMQMTKKVRVKCARCRTVNVAVTGD
jgi:phage FluMu protein Com